MQIVTDKDDSMDGKLFDAIMNLNRSMREVLECTRKLYENIGTSNQNLNPLITKLIPLEAAIEKMRSVENELTNANSRS